MSGKSRGEARRFHIHTCLGSGGFGEVYRATMISPGGVRHEVAVKVLHEGLDPKSQGVQRLRDEGRMLGILRHPAILGVHDLVVLNGRVAMVAEYIEGGDLDLAFRLDVMPARPLLEVIAQVASALEVAWNTLAPESGEPLRLVHRDVKPANIRVGVHGQVKLLDFGIAKADGLTREARTQARAVLGSYAYMSPERLSNRVSSHPSGDVYSLGCVLYEGSARRRLSSGMDLRDQLAQAQVPDTHRSYVREAVDALHSVDPRVRDLMLEMLSYDADLRPSPGELSSRCEALADELPGPNLRQWSRQFEWSVPMDAQGALAGQTLTESTVVSDVHEIEPDAVAGRFSETIVDWDQDPVDEPSEDASHTAPPIQYPEADPRARTILTPSSPSRDVQSPSSVSKSAGRPADTVVTSDSASNPSTPGVKKAPEQGSHARSWRPLVLGLLTLAAGTFAVVMGMILVFGLYWSWETEIPSAPGDGTADLALPPAPAEVESAPVSAAVVPKPVRPAAVVPSPAVQTPPKQEESQPIETVRSSDEGAVQAPIENSDLAENPSEGEGEEPVVPEPLVTTGRVVVEGRNPAELRARGQVLPPGEVPVGSWDVYVDFGSGMVRGLSGPVIVGVGTETVIRCSSVKQTCSR